MEMETESKSDNHEPVGTGDLESISLSFQPYEVEIIQEALNKVRYERGGDTGHLGRCGASSSLRTPLLGNSSRRG